MKTKQVGLMIALGAMGIMPVYAAGGEDDALLKWLRRSNAVYSPLEAAEYGSVVQMEDAVMEEPLQVNAVDELGRTALHIAAGKGKTEAVKILLEAGADSAACDADGKLPLDVAQGDEVKQLLVAAGEVRAKELQLCKDVQAGNVAAVKAALAAGVNADALSADKRGTVLCVAVLSKNAEIVKELLSAGADANFVNSFQKSVLHVAAVNADGEVIRALLAAGADPMHPGNNGATPLHDAIWSRNTRAVEALIPAYAECNYTSDGKGNGYPITMAIVGNRADYVQMFINAGMNLNAKCFAKCPLLHLAVMHDRVFMVKMLLDAGADRNAVDEHGKKAVDYAKGEAYELLK